MTEADIILLGHGSRRGIATNEGLRDAVARLQARVGPGVRVRLGGFEFTRPSLWEAAETLIAEGSRRIVVVPFFLFDGKHITLEIPEELEKLASQFPEVEILYTRTLGTDPRLIDLVMDRLHQGLTGDLCASSWCGCLAQQPALGVLFVNRGSHLEFDAGHRLQQLSGLVAERLGPGALVEPAQAEYASPTIVEAADKLAAAGAKTILVMPYIFFPGKVLYVNILPGVEVARTRRPSVEFLVAPTLGVDDRLIQVAVERAEEALRAGSLRVVAPVS